MTAATAPSTSTPSAIAPLAANERIETLDVLRGLALLGIFLMNVEYFTAPLTDLAQGIAPGQYGLDRWADAFVYVFVRSKFWTLFSLLFGMGFAVMLSRAGSDGAGFVPMYLRRSLGLLAIGLVHAWLIWAGDILVWYAIAALALLLFRRASLPALWRTGATLYLAVVGLMLLGAVSMWALGGLMPDAADAAADRADAALRQAEIAAYASGSYADAVAMRLRFFARMFGVNLVLVPMVLGLFLLGAWLVRSGAIVTPVAHRRLFARLLWIGGPLGLAITLASVMIDPNPHTGGSQPMGRALFAMTLHMLAAPLMALAYMALVVFALQRGGRWLRGLAPAGRMALSNYLMQSLVGTLVFYGYGLGLWGQVARAWQVLGVVAVFALQLQLSRWWLARFRYGPVEWLWRAFTYWRWPPMRRAAAPAT